MLKKHHPDVARRISLAAGLLLGLASLSLHADNATPSATLITYDSQHNLLPKVIGSEPLLTIYENGSMRAVFPKFMRLAGTHQAQLSDEKLQEIKSLITTPTIQNIDETTISEEIVEQKKAQEQIGNGTLFAVHDSTTTIIKYSQESGENQSAETVAGQDLSQKKIVQKDITLMARQYPGAKSLQEANQLKRILQNILDTTDWKPIGGDS